MRNAHCRTWNMARKLKISENENYTLQDVKYGEENWKSWKIQKCPLQDVEYGKKTENMENEKHLHDDLKNDKITKKCEKCEMHTEGPGIWREN